MVKLEEVSELIETAKKLFVDIMSPNMTLEKIVEVVSPRLDETIRKYERAGLKYSAGKFSIKYLDEKHFKMAFELYFQDLEGKWHKSGNESEAREAVLLERGAWKTIEALKEITFPIEKGEEVLAKDEKLEEYRATELDKEIMAEMASKVDLKK